MNKRFHTYIGQEMFRRLLEYPYMSESDFLSCPTESKDGRGNSRIQDHRFMSSFLCMIFYRYSDYTFPFLEPTGNSIKHVIHRQSCCMPRTYLNFLSQVFSCRKRSPQLRMLRLLIRTFALIELHDLPYPLIRHKDFDHGLYVRMVHQCFPASYIVADEQEAYRLNHPGGKKRGRQPSRKSSAPERKIVGTKPKNGQHDNL